MTTFKQFLYRGWRPAVLLLSLTFIAYVLYFHQLGSLLPGYSTSEINIYNQAASWHNIVKNPVNAPYTSLLWLLTTVLHQGIITTRIVSASLGIGAALLFYGLVRTRFQYRIAFLGTIMFATSAGLLHAARMGDGVVLQMGVLAFMSTILWHQRSRYHKVPFGYLIAIVFGLLWYVPGLVWLELFGALALRKSILRRLQRTPPVHIAAWILVWLAIVSPLLWAVIQKPSLGLTLGGLPQNVHTLSELGSHMLNAVMSIAVRSNRNPIYWVGHAPLLNIIEVILTLLGTYYYYIVRGERFSFTVGTGLIALLLIGLGGSVTFAAILPFLYILITAGIALFVSEWSTVFPRNPIARITGACLVLLMVFFSAVYQVRSYFVAWPHNPTTIQAFRHHAPKR